MNTKRNAFLCWVCSIIAVGGCFLASAQETPSPDFIFETVEEPEDPAVLLLRRGDQAMREGFYENAIQNYSEYKKLSGNLQPDLSRALGKLAEAYLASGNLSLAEKYLIEEKKLRKIMPPALGAWLFSLEVQVQFQQKKWKECVAQIENSPYSMEDYGKYGGQILLLRLDSLAQLSQWEKIINILTEYFTQAPQQRSFSLESRLVKAYLADEQGQKAAAYLGELAGRIQVAEEFDFKILQVLAFAATDQIEEAFRLYRELASRCPEKPDGKWGQFLWYLAEAGYRLNRYEESEAVYQQGLTVAVNEEEQSKCLQRIADCRIAQKKMDQAKEALEQYRQRFPNRLDYTKVSMRLAELLQKQGYSLQAAELFGELSDHAQVPIQERYQAAIQQAECLVRDGQLPRGIVAYRKAATLGGTQQDRVAKALMWAAETAVTAKDLSQAAELYQTVAEQNQNSSFGSEARLQQARCLLELEKYQEAILAFQRFAEEYPTDARYWNANLQRFLAERKIAGSPDALSAVAVKFLDLARKCPERELAMQAYLECFQTEQLAGKIERCVTVLREALKKQPESPHVPLLKYQIIAACFQINREEEAFSEAEAFFQNYPALPMAADLYLLVGDYFASNGNYRRAQEYYSKLQRPPFESELVPFGIYENARCSFMLEQLDNARELLLLLLKTEEEHSELNPMLQKKAEFLLGDVYAKQGKYEEARKYFALVRNHAGDTDLGFAALGRQAEMLMSIGVTTPTTIDKAIECLNEILKFDSNAPAALKEMASYRLGKCFEEKGEPQKAALIYQEIYLNYITDRNQGKIRDWQYYYRSVFDLSRILERRGDTESLRKAARLYEDLAESKLPRSAEAAVKAKLIRDRLRNM